MTWARWSSTSRNSGKVSQPHWMPALSAAPGMSSTPSMRPISHSCRSGATGAKPTPQLPMTTVVTPCQHDGVELLVPGGLAVVVRVDVDEARRDEGAVGVDLLPPAAVDGPDLGDHAVGDGDVGRASRGARAVDDGPPSDDEVVCGHGPPGRRCSPASWQTPDAPSGPACWSRMAEAVYVDRDVPIERLELGEGAWVDVGRGWLRRGRRGVRAPAGGGAVAVEPAVPLRPRRRGAAGRLVVGAGQPAAPSRPRRGDPRAPAPLPGGVRRVRDAAVPRRHRRAGLPPRHRHAVPRGHDHRRPQPRRHPAVVPAPPVGPPLARARARAPPTTCSRPPATCS